MKKYVLCPFCNVFNEFNDSKMNDDSKLQCVKCNKQFKFDKSKSISIDECRKLICPYCGHENEYDKRDIEYMILKGHATCYECTHDFGFDLKTQSNLKNIKKANKSMQEKKFKTILPDHSLTDNIVETKRPVQFQEKPSSIKETLADLAYFTFVISILLVMISLPILGGYLIYRHFNSPEHVQERIEAQRKEELHNEKKAAWEAVKSQVRISMFTDPTAHFPHIDVDEYVDETKPGVFEESAYVDCQNAFGAKTRKRFHATVSREAGYKVTDFSWW